VTAQVDKLGRARDDADGRFNHNFGRRDEGDDRAIVVGVDVRAEDDGARDRFDRFDQTLDDARVSTLAEVGHTLDDAFHVAQY
jgi:hypothetical protein